MRYLKYFLTLFFIFNTVFPQTQYTILISFDGFRWDYTSRGLTPTFDHIKQNGVAAVSLLPAFPSKTFPNHLSIVTGLHPENHGIIANDFWSPACDCWYSIRDTNAVRNGDWYNGEMIWEPLKKNGIKTASYFWPGSEISVDERRPDYFEKYDHYRPYDKRVEGIIEWLTLPYPERPKFLTLYFDATDSYGHSFGPNSPEVNAAIQNLDSMLNKLFLGLERIGLKDSANIIVVSDHGMTDVSADRVIDIESLLDDNLEYKIVSDGPKMFIGAESEQREKIFSQLSKHAEHFQVYQTSEVPKYLHFSKNENILDIVVIAEMGWSLVHKKSGDWMRYRAKGNHGYENFNLDMHGIFYAIGPSFRKGFSIGTVSNLDIYPLLCKIYNIDLKHTIDGSLADIEMILSQNKIGSR